ncbi:dr1-associated corepressor-like [Dysidea avara]|uniref:dr1-associated corepressor-like n=1 Tax=Dysidea avara TaxID=196820 RepID=UPI003326E805
MPPKKKRFESRFPPARIKKIMQLDDDVGKVAASVPLIISRAVEIFLQKMLTKADEYASSRQTKTITVQHIKHCIDNEKEWDFLKALVAKIPDINSSEALANEEGKKRGRKRKSSTAGTEGKSANKLEVPVVRKRKRRKSSESKTEDGYSSSGDDSTHQQVQDVPSASTSSALPVIQEMNTAVIPTPVISATTSTGVSQQLHGGSSDIAAMGQGLFSNQTEDSDDDYDA